MTAGKIDWLEIEKDFRETGLSYRKLAEKHQVSLSTLKKVAAKNRWTDYRVKAGNGKEPEPEPGEEPEPEDLHPTRVYSTEAERRQEQYERMVDAMAYRIEDALANLESDNVFAIKMLAGALKDLRILLNIRDPLDLEEQRARIAKLRREAQLEDGKQEIAVSILGVDVEELGEIIG